MHDTKLKCSTITLSRPFSHYSTAITLLVDNILYKLLSFSVSIEINILCKDVFGPTNSLCMASIFFLAASTLGFFPVITITSDSDGMFGRSILVSVSSRIYSSTKQEIISF